MPSFRCKIRKHRRNERRSSSYESVMRTLLLQNQQIIIQQQNMMFMLIKQHYPAAAAAAASAATSPSTTQTTLVPTQLSLQPQQAHDSFNPSQQPHQQQAQTQNHLQQPQQQPQSQQQQPSQPLQLQPQQHHHQPQQPQPQQQQPSQQQQQPPHQQSHQMQLDDTLSALLESDGLMTNNLLYNPTTDIGSITPYKGHLSEHDHHESPPYYSSESLTTPRVEQQRSQLTVNVSQNVVKNLNDSFKSPTKPAKINVQILSGSATREMKNSKAKIIQSMNISEFLRQVHHDESIRSSQ